MPAIGPKLEPKLRPEVRHLAMVGADAQTRARVRRGASVAKRVGRCVGAALMAAACVATDVLSAGPAAAQAPSSSDMCNNADKAYPPDVVIYGCSSVIGAGSQNPLDVAIALNNRGLAFRAKGDIARALADYDAAVQLDPGYAGAYNNRGVTLHDRGEIERAFADYDQAIRLDPRNATAFVNRGKIGRASCRERVYVLV